MVKKDESSDSESEDDYSSDEDMVDPDIKIIPTTIKSFYKNYLQNNEINLQPLYQREFTWNDKKQDFYIDSIFKGYPSQIIILNKLFGDDKFMYECIDGHHRLTVIKKYIEGKLCNDRVIRWKKGATNVLFEENERTIGHNIKCKEYATDNQKKKFNSYQLIIVIVRSKLSEKKKQNIFNRLQNGEQISAIEKLKNINNPLINKLYKDNAFKSTTYNKEDTIWNTIYERIHNEKQIRGNNYITMMSFFVIKCTMIALDRSLNIQTYDDTKLKKYLETTQDEVKNIDTIYPQVKDTLAEICESVKFATICPYFVYILIYLSVKDDYRKYYKNILKNYKSFEKFNKFSVFVKGKEQIDSDILTEIKDKMIG